jgi:hypothetical protein
MKVLEFPCKKSPRNFAAPAVATMPKSVLAVFNVLRQRNPSLTVEVFQVCVHLMTRKDWTSQAQQMVDSEWIVGLSALEQMEAAINDYVSCTLEAAIESVQNRTAV